MLALGRTWSVATAPGGSVIKLLWYGHLSLIPRPQLPDKPRKCSPLGIHLPNLDPAELGLMI